MNPKSMGYTKNKNKNECKMTLPGFYRVFLQRQPGRHFKKLSKSHVKENKEVGCQLQRKFHANDNSYVNDSCIIFKSRLKGTPTSRQLQNFESIYFNKFRTQGFHSASPLRFSDDVFLKQYQGAQLGWHR
jgi:hypothetical protein